jgi:hypothetical protein
MDDRTRTRILICAKLEKASEPYLADNVIARCGGCQTQIQHRPCAKADQFLCIDCARPNLTALQTIEATQQILADLQLYLRRGMH